jgi:hypothetical protein
MKRAQDPMMAIGDCWKLVSYLAELWAVNIMRCFRVYIWQETNCLWSSMRCSEARQPRDMFGASGMAVWLHLKVLKWQRRDKWSPSASQCIM